MNIPDLTFSFVAAVIIAVVAGRLTRTGVGGLISVGVTLVVLIAQGEAPVQLLAAVLLLVLGGLIFERHRLAGIAVVTAGATALVLTDPFPARPLFQLACVVYLVIVGLLTLDYESRFGASASFLMWFSVVGIFGTVPSTDTASVLLVASTALLISPGMRGPGTFPFVGMAIWAAVLGGQPRTGAIVGGLACFGILIIEPISRRFPEWMRPLGGELSTRLLLVTHLLVVSLASRVAGFREKSEPALILAFLAFLLGWGIIALKGPPTQLWRQIETRILRNNAPRSSS